MGLPGRRARGRAGSSPFRISRRQKTGLDEKSRLRQLKHSRPGQVQLVRMNEPTRTASVASVARIRGTEPVARLQASIPTWGSSSAKSLTNRNVRCHDAKIAPPKTRVPIPRFSAGGVVAFFTPSLHDRRTAAPSRRAGNVRSKRLFRRSDRPFASATSASSFERSVCASKRPMSRNVPTPRTNGMY